MYVLLRFYITWNRGVSTIMDDDQFCCIGIVALVFIVILFSWDLGAGIVGTIVIVLIIGAIYDSKNSDKKKEKEKVKQLEEKIKKMKDDGYNVDELEEKLKSVEK